MNGMLGGESLYLTDIFILFSSKFDICFLKYVLLHISKGLIITLAASSHCTAMCTLFHKLLLKHSFKCDIVEYTVYPTAQFEKFKTIIQVLNSDEIHFYDSKGHKLHRKRERTFYFGEIVGTLWEVYLG